MSGAVPLPPNLLANFEAACAGLRRDRLGLVLDFDGTLSEFVPVLENAVIHPDVVSPLGKLAERLALVGVMSGRSARDVERRVGIEGIVYIGNHGAERIVDGALTERVGAGAQSAETFLARRCLKVLARRRARPRHRSSKTRGFSASLALPPRVRRTRE